MSKMDSGMRERERKDNQTTLKRLLSLDPFHVRRPGGPSRTEQEEHIRCPLVYSYIHIPIEEGKLFFSR